VAITNFRGRLAEGSAERRRWRRSSGRRRGDRRWRTISSGETQAKEQPTEKGKTKRWLGRIIHEC